MNKYSVVVPVHNEEGTVALLCARIKEAMDGIAPGRYEVIFVDDGSTDRTFYFLKEIVNKIKELVVVRLDKNYGQSLALQAGFDISQGEMIITLDGDLQNDPAYISRLLEKKEEGYDVVCGWLKFKHARLSRAMVSYIANIIQRIVFKVKIHDVGSMFRVYSRSALSGI